MSGWTSQALGKSKFRQGGNCGKRVSYIWSSEAAKVKQQLSQHCHNLDWRESLLNPTWSVCILLLDLSLGQYQPPARPGGLAHGYGNGHRSSEMLEGWGAAASESQLEEGPERDCSHRCSYQHFHRAGSGISFLSVPASANPLLWD